MNKIIVKCSNCKGRGYNTDVIASVFSLGLWNLFEYGENYKSCITKDECIYCKGKGVLKICI